MFERPELELASLTNDNYDIWLLSMATTIQAGQDLRINSTKFQTITHTHHLSLYFLRASSFLCLCLSLSTPLINIRSTPVIAMPTGTLHLI